jgi:hypothetical protein
MNVFLFPDEIVVPEHKKAGTKAPAYMIFSRDHTLVALRPNSSDTINRTRKIKNRILAMDAAPAAIPPNPKIAAMIATIRNITVQRNIVYSFRLKKIVFLAFYITTVINRNLSFLYICPVNFLFMVMDIHYRQQL